MASPVVLVLGAGGNIGAAVARRFTAAGWRVALVSRSAAPVAGAVSIKGDLTDPSSLPSIFAAVKAALPAGSAAPSLVVYNAANVTPVAAAGNVFSVPDKGWEADLALMVTSPYRAAGEAFRLWQAEGAAKGAFVYTGNKLSKGILPVENLATLGVGKNGAEYWIGLADTLYKKKGYRFFVADQRTESGAPVSKPAADAHADLFLNIAEGKLNDQNFHLVFGPDGAVQDFDAAAGLQA